MKETNRLIKLFNDHYYGMPWLDVSIVEHLDSIDYKTASIKLGNTNSIWQLVYHMMHWRKQNMTRISGKTAVDPDHNFIIEITDTSEKAWEKIKSDFEKSHIAFIDFLENFDENNLDEIYQPNGFSYYEHIQGILIHDAYHLGQIVLLKKTLSS